MPAGGFWWYERRGGGKRYFGSAKSVLDRRGADWLGQDFTEHDSGRCETEEEALVEECARAVEAWTKVGFDEGNPVRGGPFPGEQWYESTVKEVRRLRDERITRGPQGFRAWLREAGSMKQQRR